MRKSRKTHSILQRSSARRRNFANNVPFAIYECGQRASRLIRFSYFCQRRFHTVRFRPVIPNSAKLNRFGLRWQVSPTSRSLPSPSPLLLVLLLRTSALLQVSSSFVNGDNERRQMKAIPSCHPKRSSTVVGS